MYEEFGGGGQRARSRRGVKERAAGGISKSAGSRRNKERFFATMTTATATATRKPKKQQV